MESERVEPSPITWKSAHNLETIGLRLTQLLLPADEDDGGITRE
eukprot:CAMPEP_0202715368 /NCGR_PEP_ID=MMETSP1385-20130828/88913_1 /ASSEMBLY_ACC=CAM_ASM_000861 /TAXON_ID=933848 /ORGANISM="Elphidium margaritaceum" /LENGTH=43 /DNA_ID= /DNA_START= /DNA_END= /DNA_ORIENTATION=